MCLKKKLNIFLNCFNFLRLNTCPCFTNFILTKINFIRKFNAAPLHVALSIDIGNRLLTPLHELMIRAYEREYVSFFKGVEFLLCPIASCIWDDRLFVRHPEILITDFCFCLVLGWLWWLNRQGLCGGKTRTKNGLWPREEPPPHPRTLSPRSFEGWPIVRGWFRSLACIEFPQVWTSVLFSWKETRKLTPFRRICSLQN